MEDRIMFIVAMLVIAFSPFAPDIRYTVALCALGVTWSLGVAVQFYGNKILEALTDTPDTHK